MEIHVAIYPSPMNYFLISVELKDGALTFQNTKKGHRIIKQKLIEKKKRGKEQKTSDEWRSVVIRDREPEFEYEVKWNDMNYKDWINDEIWETVWERPLPKQLSEALLYFSHLISDNHENLKEVKAEMGRFEELILNVISELKSKGYLN